MYRGIKGLMDYSLHATDGKIGNVEDYYFDNGNWTIRYLIVNLGIWLFGRKVLISPQVLLAPDWRNKEFPLRLSRQQIHDSPDIDVDGPVTRQQEEQLHAHYAWKGYWKGVLSENQAPADPQLHSMGRFIGYHIHATDIVIGKVTDFLIDDNSWEIIFLVVRTGHWMESKEMLISPEWIKEVLWKESVIVVNVFASKIKTAPDYKKTEPVDSLYEQALFEHYKGDKLQKE